jgi:hypothetical protein
MKNNEMCKVCTTHYLNKKRIQHFDRGISAERDLKKRRCRCENDIK